MNNLLFLFIKNTRGLFWKYLDKKSKFAYAGYIYSKKEFISKKLLNLLKREVHMKRYTLFLICFLLMVAVFSLVDAKGSEPVLSSARWDNDIRIGDRDSVNGVAFDVDYSNGNLFAALKNTESGSDYWSVNISTDTGRTWTETSFMGPGIVDIDGAVFNSYFYVVYASGNRALMRRFNTSDGSWDVTYGTDTVTSSGFNIREIALASTQDFSPPTRVYCFVIREDNSLEYHYSSEDVETWSTLGVVSLNADRGLDACCNEGHSSEYVWCSYIGTNDSVYIGSVGSTWNSYGPLTDVDYPIGGFNITSIGAYRDTVMVLYPYCGGEFAFFVNSCVSYDGGDSWSYEGTVFGPNATSWGGSAITGRKGGGFGAVMTCYNYGVYRYRDYPAGVWSDTVHFTDGLVEPRVKPAIEFIAENSYGIVYVNAPIQGAWFDISQWPVSGVEETIPDEREASLLGAIPSVFTSRTSIEYILGAKQNISLDVYDILGNHVMNLASGQVSAGKNSVIWDGKDDSGNPVASGMYFCVLETSGGKDVEKLTLLR